MNKFENPIDFDLTKQAENNSIAYSDLVEIAQGGPQVGILWINQKKVSSTPCFGGPILYEDGYIYAPIFVRKFCLSGFRVCKINVETLQTKMLGSITDIVFLDRIQNNFVHYFVDLEKRELNSISKF